jgi:hypothetical protein
LLSWVLAANKGAGLPTNTGASAALAALTNAKTDMNATNIFTKKDFLFIITSLHLSATAHHETP